VNCSAIPRELLESELFGYEAGSFTGAQKGGKRGKFELAEKGRIFLDEVGDMPLQMQSELLRVLQEKEVERIGGTTSIKLDFRVIAATNKNLKEMVESGLFREDLFYRLNVVRIELPPLRRRIEDIPLLTTSFLNQKCKALGVAKIILTPEALRVLQNYSYPGNIRELMNVLEKAISQIDLEEFSSRELILTEDNIKSILAIESHPRRYFLKGNQLTETKRIHEAKVISEALRLSGGNIANCAKMMGIHRTSLHRKIKLYNLYPDILQARKKT